MENKCVPLHKELKPYYEDDAGMSKIRHPLVYSVPHFPELNDFVNRQLEHKKKKIKEAFEKKNWPLFMVMHEKPYRLYAFEKIMSELEDKDYWNLLANVWITSENISDNLRTWRKLLFRSRMNEEGFMTESERKKLKDLPEKFTIFRACTYRSKNGLSYTLDPDIAKFFAKRTRSGRFIVKKEVKKSQVFAYLEGRGESEIILYPKQ